jgi:hypothetical protein
VAKGKKKKTPVDPTAAVRAELLEALRSGHTTHRTLARLVDASDQVGRALLSLATRDADPLVRNAAAGLLLALTRDPSLPDHVTEPALDDAAAAAQLALGDPSVADEAKQLCLTVIELAGDEPEVDDVTSCFQDFHGSLARMTALMARGLEDGAESVDVTMAPLLEADEVDAPALEGSLAMCAVVAKEQPRVGATALLTVAAVAQEQGLGGDVVERAIDAAVKASPERAAWLLDELARWPAAGALGDRARQVAEQLTVERLPMVSPPIAHALVTNVDSSGSRSALVALRRGDGAFDALVLLLNDHVGLKDVATAWGSGADAIEELTRTDLTCAPCGLEVVRSLVGDALALHEAQGRPLPGRLLGVRHLLGAEPLLPARRAPDLSTYGLETHARSADMVGGSADLMEDPAFGCLPFASSAAYDLLAAAPSRGRKRGSARVELEAFLSAIEPIERPLLVQRLAVNLETLALAGWGRTRAGQVGASVYVALSEGVVPWAQVPYVRALAESSMVRILENLRHGHRSEAEAFAAERDLFEQQAEFDLPF